MEEDEKYMSEFNSAIATLMRIDSIKKGLTFATVKRDYNMKFIYLEAYFLELVSVLKEDDEHKQVDKYKELRKKHREYLAAIARGDKTISSGIIDAYMDWEIELKNLEQKYGMNIKTKSDPRYALGGR